LRKPLGGECRFGRAWDLDLGRRSGQSGCGARTGFAGDGETEGIHFVSFVLGENFFSHVLWKGSEEVWIEVIFLLLYWRKSVTNISDDVFARRVLERNEVGLGKRFPIQQRFGLGSCGEHGRAWGTAATSFDRYYGFLCRNAIEVG
jgi:hypothetical protein